MKLFATFAFAALLGTPAAAEDMAPVALNSLTSAPPQIASAQVMDQNGNLLGKVGKVATDQDGKPSALSYAGKGGLVVVAAPAVSYDQQKNVLVTQAAPQQVAVR